VEKESKVLNCAGSLKKENARMRKEKARKGSRLGKKTRDARGGHQKGHGAGAAKQGKILQKDQKRGREKKKAKLYTEKGRGEVPYEKEKGGGPKPNSIEREFCYRNGFGRANVVILRKFAQIS